MLFPFSTRQPDPYMALGRLSRKGYKTSINSPIALNCGRDRESVAPGIDISVVGFTRSSRTFTVHAVAISILKMVWEWGLLKIPRSVSFSTSSWPLREGQSIMWHDAIRNGPHSMSSTCNKYSSCRHRNASPRRSLYYRKSQWNVHQIWMDSESTLLSLDLPSQLLASW